MKYEDAIEFSSNDDEDRINILKVVCAFMGLTLERLGITEIPYEDDDGTVGIFFVDKFMKKLKDR